MGFRRVAREGLPTGRSTHIMRLAGLLPLGLLLAAPSAVSALRARDASTYSLSDSAHLRLTSHRGLTLNEQGTASGTIAGPIYIHLKVASTNRVTAEVSLYPSGSSITGEASASYRPSGGVATFTGTMSIVRGTGRYDHASGSAISFTGSIRRLNDAVTVRVSGRLST
jgi:hypothetical protein